MQTSGVSCSESGRWASPIFFVPRTLWRTWGTRRFPPAMMRPLVAAKHQLGYRCQLHVRGAFVDLADLCVAVVLLDGVVLHKAVTAKYLHGVAGDAFGYMRSKVLAHRGFFQEAKSVVLEAGTVINHEPGGFDFGCHFGEVKLDRLKLPDRFAELLAFKSVSGGVRPGALG